MSGRIDLEAVEAKTCPEGESEPRSVAGKCCQPRTAQLFSLDVIFAMLVVSSIFGLLILMNSNVPSTIGSIGLRASIQEDAQGALLLLMATPGEPSNWTLYDFALPQSADVRSIGLASSPWVIDPAKLSKLSSVNQTNLTFLRGALGLSKPDYNFEFSIRYPNGTQVAIAGVPRSATNRTSTISSGYAAIGGQPVIASVMVWVGEYE
jgi:hypothetical protein